MSTAATPPPTPAAERTPPRGALRHSLACLLLSLVVGAASGSVSALFLWSLDQVTSLRFEHSQLTLLLPIVGVFMVWCYRRWGGEAGRGSDLIFERIRLQNSGIPPRITPFIFGGSILSHLAGASTGREGAAVQMGAGIASLALRLSRLPAQYARLLLTAGVAAGFSSIFGTPLAGAIFAVEAPNPGNLSFRMLPIALAASYCGDLVCRAWGAQHAAYVVGPFVWQDWLSPKNIVPLMIASLLFGWAGRLFVVLQLGFRRVYARVSAAWWVPPFLGGCLLLGASHAPLLVDYLGLGTWSTRTDAVTLSSAFTPGGATDQSWILKLALTAFSLASGFKGGEVTPLFFIGATLGNAFASHMHLSPPLYAALGFVAVFAGVAHTPLTGTLMAAELFGPVFALVFAPVCWLAHRACGSQGIYSGQFPRNNAKAPT